MENRRIQTLVLAVLAVAACGMAVAGDRAVLKNKRPQRSAPQRPVVTQQPMLGTRAFQAELAGAAVEVRDKKIKTQEDELARQAELLAATQHALAEARQEAAAAQAKNSQLRSTVKVLKRAVDASEKAVSTLADVHTQILETPGVNRCLTQQTQRLEEQRLAVNRQKVSQAMKAAKKANKSPFSLKNLVRK